MQVALFKALKSANVGDDEATAVVEQLALHVESVVNNNIRAIEGKIASVDARVTGVDARVTGVDAKLAGLQARIDALDSKMTFLMAILALAVGLGPVLAKLIH
jgi:hypothetical protein